MRRSLAPSQRGKVLPASTSSTSCPPSCRKQDADDEVTIQRLPMFGFLEVPEALNKQFKVPSGCIITEKTLELRKQKRLGSSNSFRVIRPGDLAKGIFRVTTNFQEPAGDEEDADEEQLPTSVKDLPPFEPLVLWTDPNDPTNKVEVIPELACRLRPHQREGVQFLFECTMGLRGFEGQGCILADDMGLGKTLMSITALWTLLNQGFVKGEPAVKKVMVVCPTSLVGNWDNEIRKWVGDHCPTFAVKQEPKKVIKNFLMHRGKGVLIVSYETQRLYFKLFEEASKKSTLMMPTSTTTTVYSPVCDLIICDEAHKLKNAESELSKCLNALPARKRILLSGTPMQNELTEFFNMVNFCNPNVLGTVQEFRRRYERPILASREPDALESEVQEAGRLQKELSVIVNEFILKRGNILNAQHLPPKLVQFVCCRLTPLQEAMYERLLSSKEIRHIREGKQTNTLNSIRQLINICSHPQLILDQYQRKLANREEIDDDLAAMVEMIPKTGISVAPKPPPSTTAASSSSTFASRMEQLKSRSQMGHHQGKSSGGGFASDQFIDPEQSGKMAVLFRMMQAMRAVQRGERIVVVSNYTSTLDLIETMCQQQKWPVLRLDGTISATKRTKLVDDFNNPHSGAFAFLLSSKAGGCGINLIGGNRLVLFDPDWNPASDKQAAGRIWREGQKRRCFIYRFMSTGSIEEKIIQRQLSKEGLVDIVDDKEQVNQFSSDELRQLFTLLKDTRSDTHDTLMCPRCTFVKQKRGASGGGGGKGPKMSEAQQQACLKFLSDFESFLQQETVAFQQREAIRLQAAASASPGNETWQALVKKATAKVYETLPFHDRIAALAQRVRDKDFDNLTAYSRRQREIFQEIENDLKGDLNDIYEAEDHVARPPTPGPDDGGGGGSGGASSAVTMAAASHDSMLHYFSSSFSIYAQFLRQWTDIVPSLMALAHVTTARNGAGDEGTTAGGSDTANEGSDSIEQEGCPEETDLNKWSHHCCPLSCDDELFAKALGDDDALVSFIFGLEVNWSLLEQREAETRDEKERRKVQQIKDLEELNARRRAQKEKLARGEVSDDPDGDEGNGDEVAGGGGGKKKAKTTKKDASDGGKKAAKSKKTAAADGAATSKKRKRIAEEDEDSINDEEDDDEDGGDDGDDDEKDLGGPSSSDDERPAPKKASTKSKRSSDGAATVASPSPAPGKRLSKSKLDDVSAAATVAPPKKAAKSSTAATTSTAAAAAAAAVPAMVFPEEDPASFDFDVFFDQDRKKLHKLLAKGKLNIPTFDLFWKVLKTENNDWRCMLTPDGVEIFSRTPGLKIADIRKYKRNMDYFVEIPGLLNHFILQCQLRDDHVMADLLQQLLEPSSSATLPSGTTPASAAAAASAASAAVDAKAASSSSSSVVPPATASTSTTKALVVAAVDAHRRSKSPVAAVAASKKRVIQLSDDEGDSDDQHASTVPPPPATALAVAKKKTIVLDDDSDDDVNVAVTNTAAASAATSLAMKPSAPLTPPRRITPTTDDDIISFDTPDDNYFQDEPAASRGGGRDSSSSTSSSGHKRKRETLASALTTESSSSPQRQQQQQQQDEEVLPPSASKRKLKFDFQSDHEDGARPSTSSDKENRVTELLNHNGEPSSAKKRSRTSPEHLESLLTSSVSSLSASKAVSFPSLPDASQSSSQQSCSQEGPWTCEVCTFINENPAYVKKCQICKTKRFGSQRLAKRELQQLSQQV